VLDELRKHATHWVVKGTLAVIILTFILFFGWSRIADQTQDAHLYVAAVEGDGIPRRKYDNMVRASLDQLRQNISGNLPENMESLLRNNVLDQLVTREVVVRYARDLGLSVSDEEVAGFIRNNTGLFADGNFDLKAYERNFLPSYRQKNGEEFEDAVRRDLLVEKAQTLMMALFGPWEDELGASLEELQKAEQAAARKPSVSSASPLDLFADWVQDRRHKTKIETY
jgi:hypothetical protein